MERKEQGVVGMDRGTRAHDGKDVTCACVVGIISNMRGNSPKFNQNTQ